MKQVFLVFTVALMLVAIVGTNTEARQYLYNIRDAGEDHPWGGENPNDGNQIVTPSPEKGQLDFTTDYSLFDSFVWKFIIRLWIIDSPKTDVSISDEIPIGTVIAPQEFKQNETRSSSN
ncbi:MAG: hypothetical protein DRP47_00825 [Candidatus Zixiibacteriota bacterium]|nr:MAG: hypothetical protein DRP47_00825 [candidate division Zixibacteria bacterium]